MASSSSSSPFVTTSAHRDILEADIPADPTALVAELKRRATAAVGASQWYDAAGLYDKAIQCCRARRRPTTSLSSNDVDTDPARTLELAIFYANSSLCLGKMNRWNDALEAAERAVAVDASYIKGWWRLSQAQAALHAYTKAVSSLEHAVTLDSNNNKVLLKELVKLQQQQQLHQDEQERKNAAGVGQQQQLLPDITTTIISEPKQRVAGATTPVAPTTGGASMETDDDADQFTKSDHVKGYKIVQGKKTSYFHHELSDDAARLIGDIAPQKIDPTTNTTGTTGAAGVDSNDAAAAATSVWNTAGTWEEKDYSVWAQSTLIESVRQASHTFAPSSPAPGAQLTVTHVVIAPSSGHASVATVRGKKRYMYEMDVTVHWSFRHETPPAPPFPDRQQPHHNGNGDSLAKISTATGTLRFPDVDGTHETGDLYDVSDFVVTDTNDASVIPLVTHSCRTASSSTDDNNSGGGGSLRMSLQNQLDAWVHLFRHTY